MQLAVANCKQVVTLEGPRRPRVGPEMRDLAVIADGMMLVRDSRIEAVGPRVKIEPLISGDTEVVDAGNRIVLPGFVDAHTHPVFAGTRAGEFEMRAEGATYREIAAAGGGIRSTVRATLAASEEDLLAAAQRYRDWFLRAGTTTVEAKSGYGLSLESELKILRVIKRLGYVPTFLGAHEIPDEYRGRRTEYVSLVINEMLPAVAREGLAEFCDVFCEPSVFPVGEARAILEAAQRCGFDLRIHADQFTEGGAMLAAELRAATADHLEATGEDGMRELAVAGVQPVLLPGSVYALGSTRYPDARHMISLGLAVVLATDFNPGSSPTASMPMVLSLACTQMKMTPAEAITAATVNAAYSLRRGDEIGTLEAGKQADFVIHDCEDYRELAYFFGRDTASIVFMSGNRIWSRN